MAHLSLHPFMAIVLSLAFVSAAQTRTYGQTAKQTPPQQPAASWLVNCNNQANPKALQCVMSHSIVRQETGQRVLAASITGKGDALAFTLALPHGLDLQAGVDIAIDNGAVTRYQIQTADESGSYSRFALTPPMIAAMKNGDMMSVTVTTGSKQRLAFPVSLVGFADSLALLPIK